MQKDSSSTGKSNFYWPCQPTTPPYDCTCHFVQKRVCTIFKISSGRLCVEYKRACICAAPLASTAESSASPPLLCTTDTDKQGNVITYPPTLPLPKVGPTGMKTTTEIVPEELLWLLKLPPIDYFGYRNCPYWLVCILVADIPPFIILIPLTSLSKWRCRQSDLRSNTGKCTSTFEKNCPSLHSP